MIRPMQHTDTPDVLTLLHWMDGAPEREVFAPDARDPYELRMEVEDSRCYVTDGPDGVDAYCGISPFRDGMILEGPVGHDPARMKNLIERAVKDAEGLPVYAFCSRDNTLVRDALEATASGDWAGFHRRYVAGREPLPIDAALHDLGLRLIDAGAGQPPQVAQDPMASAQARARWQAFVGR